MRLEATLIYLLGFPGTGKYTVACELARLAGAKVIDNHYVDNPIFGLLEQGGTTPLPAEMWTQVARVRATVFDTLRTLSPRFHSFVLTNDLIEGDAGDRGAMKPSGSSPRTGAASSFPCGSSATPTNWRAASSPRSAPRASRRPTWRRRAGGLSHNGCSSRTRSPP